MSFITELLRNDVAASLAQIMFSMINGLLEILRAIDSAIFEFVENTQAGETFFDMYSIIVISAVFIPNLYATYNKHFNTLTQVYSTRVANIAFFSIEFLFLIIFFLGGIHSLSYLFITASQYWLLHRPNCSSNSGHFSDLEHY